MKKEMQEIGFVARRKSTNSEQKRSVDKSVLDFDSGKSLSMDSLFVHLLAMGTTGSGKTKAGMCPVLAKVLLYGLRGLVIDVKGNLRQHVRALAAAAGRSDDIVEFGTAESAVPLNILENMTEHQVFTFFESLTRESFHGQTNNMDFHAKGVEQLCLCVKMLRLMAVQDAEFTPTLTLLSEMLDTPLEASRLYDIFKECFYDAADKSHKKLVNTIDSDAFHVLHYGRYVEGADNNTRKPHKGVPRDRYLEQSNYAIKSAKNALRQFIQVPGIARGFCTAGSGGVDMGAMLEQGKVVLLRFDPSTGPVGTQLSRRLIESYYEAVYTLGVEKASHMPSFVCIDEFQEVADLSAARFSDANFIAQAREFRAAFIAATQSASALVNRSRSVSAVEAFVSNCNNRILFYSDDIETQSFVTRYDNRVRLVDLQPGEAFVTVYDNKTREHTQSIETLQNAYMESEACLQEHKESGKDSEAVLPVCEDSQRDLGTLLDVATQYAAQKADEKELTEVKEPQEHVVQEHTQGDTPMNRTTVNTDEENTLSAEDAHARETNAHIIARFPEYFSDEGACFPIPHGWHDVLIGVLTAFQASKLYLQIENLSVHNGTLQHEAFRGSDNVSISLFNTLLAVTRHTCTLCGGHVSVKKKKSTGYHGRGSGTMPICSECLVRFQLKKVRKDVREAENAMTGRVHEDACPHLREDGQKAHVVA